MRLANSKLFAHGILKPDHAVLQRSRQQCTIWAPQPAFMESSILPRPTRPGLLHKPLFLQALHLLGRIPINHSQSLAVFMEHHCETQTRHCNPVVCLAQSSGDDKQGILITGIHVSAGVEVVILAGPVLALDFLSVLGILLTIWRTPETIELQLAVCMWVLSDLIRFIVSSHIHFSYLHTRKLTLGKVPLLDPFLPPRRIDTGRYWVVFGPFTFEDRSIPISNIRGRLMAVGTLLRLPAFEGAKARETYLSFLSGVYSA